MMKISKLILLAMVAAFLMAANAWAKPEKIQIKETDKAAKERLAKAKLRTVELRNVEDPEARKAIEQILNYLNLQTK